MARYTGPVDRRNRRLGLAVKKSKKKNPPGQLSKKRRRKISDFGMQLQEKQKIKMIYGMLERQFRRFFEIANRKTGVTGDNLIILLERRLDNTVYRLSMASNRRQARQLVNHGHIHVNGRKVDIPSYLVKIGDVITVKERSRSNHEILTSLGNASSRVIPEWVELDIDAFTGKVLALPKREDIDLPANEQAVVELYSK